MLVCSCWWGYRHEPPVAQRTEHPPPKRVMWVRFPPGGRCENYIVFYSGVAQLAAQATVNRRVVGSSPAAGADARETGPILIS